MKHNLCIGALVLWVFTVAGIGWFFVQGWTAKGTDGRTEVRLATAERDLILGEMRQLLKTVDQIGRAHV